MDFAFAHALNLPDAVPVFEELTYTCLSYISSGTNTRKKKEKKKRIK